MEIIEHFWLQFGHTFFENRCGTRKNFYHMQYIFLQNNKLHKENVQKQHQQQKRRLKKVWIPLERHT